MPYAGFLGSCGILAGSARVAAAETPKVGADSRNVPNRLICLQIHQAPRPNRAAKAILVHPTRPIRSRTCPKVLQPCPQPAEQTAKPGIGASRRRTEEAGNAPSTAASTGGPRWIPGRESAACGQGRRMRLSAQHPQHRPGRALPEICNSLICLLFYPSHSMQDTHSRLSRGVSETKSPNDRYQVEMAYGS